MNFIKSANKVIVPDAVINDAVFEFLKHRELESMVYVENKFKKWQDVPATQLNSEQDFLNKIQDNIKNNSPFLFGCDSKTVADTFYNDCIKKIPRIQR